MIRNQAMNIVRALAFIPADAGNLITAALALMAGQVLA